MEKPNISFDDIGGLEAVKAELKELVTMPVQYADDYEAMGQKVSVLCVLGVSACCCVCVCVCGVCRASVQDSVSAQCPHRPCLINSHAHSCER